MNPCPVCGHYVGPGWHLCVEHGLAILGTWRNLATGETTRLHPTLKEPGTTAT